MKKTTSEAQTPYIIGFSILFLLVVWQVSSVFINSILILPSPILVFSRLYELAQTLVFWQQVGGTLLRCVYAFVLSIICSLFLGILSALSIRFSIFLRFPLAMVKSTPVVSFILLAVFWFTSTMVPVFVSVLLTVPVLTAAIASGIRSTDVKLKEMTQVFHFTLRQKIRYLYVPSVMPYFLSAALSSLGLTWKVIVSGEVLTLPKNSVGSALQTAKVHLETVDVFAWTIAVIVLSFCAETLFKLYVRRQSAMPIVSQNEGVSDE